MRFFRFGRPRQYDSGNYYRPSFFGGFSFFPPVIKALLIWNVGVFLFFVFFGPIRIGGVPLTYLLQKWLALFPLGGDFYPWQLLTYLFLHGGFWHLFFNMFVLWMFGMEIENVWGSKRFLIFYLVCGIGAGLSNLLIAPLFGPVGPTVGASGAVYGVLIAFALMFPDRQVFIFPFFFIPIRAKYFVAFLLFTGLFFGVTGSSDGIAHFAHLGGAAVGYLYLLLEGRGLPSTSFFNHLQSAWRASFRSRPSSGSDKYREASEAKFFDVNEDRKKTGEEVNQEKIDEILDKISVSGYQSLTEEEKRILFDASKKLN